ncbi:hypothetical protein ASC95_25720 [Pelomonas sp. Root1217]|uniref:hypothetical protein n=1 Tax=Pelomonas sp. Root1217 TaxID=1736430 RepID=UPI00070C34A3|nr:hypothetical protein [Pelomonas sp. Root1217]KQV46919.1 hypothetical protein ASC95_25720 [Pelomonas sp. Root1217]
MASESFTLTLAASGLSEYLPRLKLTRDNFGIHYVRWPYDPAVRTDGTFASKNPSRWQTELGDSVGWFRAFDPNLFGRYVGGAFVQVGTTAERPSYPYGRMEGGKWYQGMLRSDGSYDFSKLDLVLSACEGKNLKVLLSIGAQGAYWDGSKYLEYALPTGEFASQNWEAYQSRVLKFLGALFDHAGKRIAAIELANEPGRLVQLNAVVGPGHTERLAVLCRLTKQQITARGLRTLVLSPPFQGGEVKEISSFLNASAAGIAVGGKDGSGTRGRDWIDVLAHHNYGSFSDRAAGGPTAKLDTARINDPAADDAYPGNTAFSDMLVKGRNITAAANAGGWSGPRWNTECNVTGIVGNSGWHPRKMTEAGLKRIFFQTLLASFAAGYEKCFLYAADHPTLGFYDNTGTPPPGEPAEWYFKAPDNTARGATALAQAIAALTKGETIEGPGNASRTSALTGGFASYKTLEASLGGESSFCLGALGWIVRRRNARSRE